LVAISPAIAGVLLFASGCCSTSPTGSCGAVHRNELEAQKKRVLDEVSKNMHLAEDKHLWHVGHKLGAYVDYPHHICARGQVGRTLSVEAVMDNSFAELDGLELDVHPAPAGAADPGLFVVHDPLEKGLTSARYPTSFAALLGHFEAKHVANKKRLFVELKAHPRCSGDRLDTDYNEATLAEKMGAILGEHRAAAAQISFISFNPRALEAMHEVEPKLGLSERFKYYLIVSSKHPIMGRLICWFGSGDLPRFDTEQPVLDKPWLTGIWFSTAALSDYAETLNSINSRRKRLDDENTRRKGTEPIPALRFGVAVYMNKFDDALKTFGDAGRGLENVEAVIYDVCDGKGDCLRETPAFEGCEAD